MTTPNNKLRFAVKRNSDGTGNIELTLFQNPLELSPSEAELLAETLLNRKSSESQEFVHVLDDPSSLSIEECDEQIEQVHHEKDDDRRERYT